MNIKTTIILFVLLIGVGAVVLFTQSKDTGDVKPQVHTLVDIKSGDITRLVITGNDGKVIEAQKSSDGTAPAVWKLTKPVTATAESYKVSSLLDTLTALKSTAEVNPNASDAPTTGLDKPQYVVDLYTGSKDTRITFGNDLSVSDGVYAQIEGHDKVDVVDKAVIDSLDKPANDLRKTQLFETASPSVQQLTVTHRDGSQIVLEKRPLGWQMIKPAQMPAEQSAVEDLSSAVINMTPVEFVDDATMLTGLNHPTSTVTFSATAPSTQPTAAPMTNGTTVIFGGYDDVQKKNIFAQLPDGTVVKVAASVLDSLNKKPFELRDKKVVDIDPAAITALTVTINQAATTQPTTQTASGKTTALIRRKKTAQVGPSLPSSKPTTAPTTAPALQTDWTVVLPKPADADDSKVTSLLTQFHPLKAEKYLDKLPAAKPVKQFVLTFTTASSTTVLTIVDPGNDSPLVGSYNGLNFELPRSIATDLSAEFKK